MRTITEGTVVPRRSESEPPVLHAYPVRRTPQPGDIALCGHRKRIPQAPGDFLDDVTTCVVCADLERRSTP